MLKNIIYIFTVDVFVFRTLHLHLFTYGKAYAEFVPVFYPSMLDGVEEPQ